MMFTFFVCFFFQNFYQKRNKFQNNNDNNNNKWARAWKIWMNMFFFYLVPTVQCGGTSFYSSCEIKMRPLNALQILYEWMGERVRVVSKGLPNVLLATTHISHTIRRPYSKIISNHTHSEMSAHGPYEHVFLMMISSSHWRCCFRTDISYSFSSSSSFFFVSYSDVRLLLRCVCVYIHMHFAMIFMLVCT